MKKIIILLTTIFVTLCLSCSRKAEKNNIETIPAETSEIEENEPVNDETELDLASRKKDGLVYYIPYDDLANEDPGSVEYNLQNGNQNFCIDHDARKIEGFDYESSILVSQWGDENEFYGWVKQEREDFSVTWTYPEAIIIRLSTTSSEWKTKRGIHVGSSRKEVEAAYEKDADVYEFINEKYELIQNLENELFEIYKCDEGFSINTPNYKAEEMMTMRLYVTDDIVSKIEIKIGC